MDSDLAPRVYGEIATGCLEELKAEDARAYSIHYRVPGQSCALLMLERESDYEQFGVRAEEQAYFVHSTPVNETWRTLLANRVRLELGPRGDLLARLERFEQSLDFRGRRKALLRKFIEVASPENLTLRTENLAGQGREKARIPRAFADSLWTGAVDYDKVHEEAERRRESLSVNDALRALSSLVESRPGELDLARDVAIAALAWGRSEQAYHLFLRVVDAKPFDPQLYDDLARCCEDANRPELAVFWHELASLAQAESGRIFRGNRAGGIPVSIGGVFDAGGEPPLDYLSFLRRAVAGEIEFKDARFARLRLAELEGQFQFDPIGLRIRLSWNTDATDVDLHVLEPGGEECYYEHRSTDSGGALSNDIRRGYGPETYSLKKPAPGKYSIRAHYFQSNENRVSARTRCLLTITKNPGQVNQETRRKAVLLVESGDLQDVEDFIWE